MRLRLISIALNWRRLRRGLMAAALLLAAGCAKSANQVASAAQAFPTRAELRKIAA